MMFRRLLEMLTTETKKHLDQKTDRMVFKAHVAKLGSMLVGELNGHHNIEDAHYFPILAKKDFRIKRGFEILDRDNHALDDVLHRYVKAANAAINAKLQSSREIRKFLEETNRLESMLSLHLIDEEELVVPVILKHGAGGYANAHHQLLIEHPATVYWKLMAANNAAFGQLGLTPAKGSEQPFAGLCSSDPYADNAVIQNSPTQRQSLVRHEKLEGSRGSPLPT
ncbi:hypothetical protein GS632_20015 [Ruegeria sp. HKCCD7296]|nr:hypothetical protein [Ruegeria sp. HKCCD7296]NOE43962.1 hypothetical protein [Ruegeria sp. HKCCD7319]